MVYELAKQLVRRRGHDIVILQPSRFCRPVGKNATLDGIRVTFFPCFYLPSTNYTLPFFRRELDSIRKILSKERCQIIQSCEYSYLTSLPPILVRKLCRVPTILTTGELPGYSWFYGETVVDLVAKAYTYGMGRWIFGSYDQIVLLYKQLSAEVASLGVPRERINTIPNGIDLEEFRPSSGACQLRSELGIGDNERVLLFVGRLARVKRVETVIMLTKSLLEDGFKVKTVIVGDGPMRHYCRVLSEPVKDNIIFTGQVPHAQLRDYYALSDVLVLPSYSEGLPTVLLEASAAGKPSIATNVNGISDIVVHGETGFLVGRDESIRTYCHWAKAVFSDEGMAKRMGKNALEHVRNHFSWDEIVSRYEELYEQILDC